MSRFLYFAYGSNMLSARLLERTPSARPAGVARLHGHALRWHMAASDGSGKCDIADIGDPDAVVHGVLYEIALLDKPRLDAAEALGVGYREQHALVHTDAGPRQAHMYVALRLDPASVPYDWYHALVLTGAREHGLAADYLAHLEAVPTRPDPDSARAQRHWALTKRPPTVPPAG